MKRLDTTGRRRPNGDDSVLPLINVVFLLLIFFMLAGRLASSDPFQVSAPHSAADGAPAPRDVLVLLARDGRIAVDGAATEIGNLTATLKRIGAETVRLKADGDANAVRVVELMERIRDAGVKNLDLLTLPAGQ